MIIILQKVSREFLFRAEADDGALAWMADVDADRPEETTTGFRPDFMGISWDLYWK